MFFRKILIVLFFLSAGSMHAALAGTISLGGFTPGGNVGSTADYTVTVTGDMYLDYSVFGGALDVIPGSVINIIAGQSLTILPTGPESQPPSLSALTVFTQIEPTMVIDGNALLFSSIPITSGTFDATGNIFVGNYSALNPVPLPNAAWLLVSGLGGLAALAHRRRTFLFKPSFCWQYLTALNCAVR